MWQRSEQYDELIGEPHRRPAEPVGAPAMVRHLAIWPVPDTAEHRHPHDSEWPEAYKNRFNLRRWNWYNTLDALLQSIVARIELSNNSRFIDDYKPAGPFLNSNLAAKAKFERQHHDNPRREAETEPAAFVAPQPADVTLVFEWFGYLTKIQLVLHNEYATLSFVIDLSKEPQQRQHDAPPVQADIIADNFLDLRSAIYGANTSRLDALTKFYFTGIWKMFDDEFLCSDPALFGHTPANYDTPSPFGLQLGSELFADLRGLVLMAGNEGGLRRVKQMPDDRLPIYVESFTPRQAEDVVRAYWPFINSWVGGRDIAKNMEFTVCTMLDRRAIYISPLGMNNPRRASGVVALAPGATINYLVLLNGGLGSSSMKETEALHFDRWQVGRLIQRLHFLGTTRLVALRDLKDIRAANSDLMTYGLYLDKLYADFLNGTKREASADLQRFFGKLAATGDRSNYGLPYRIARSKYAVNSYRRVLPDLRIDRIPGWQPYDEFVRRRLYAVFDTIDMVGQRLDALRQRATVLLEIQHNRSLVHYQQLADVLVVIAGTYYIGSMMAEVAKWAVCAEWLPANTDQSKGLKPLSFLIALLLLLAWKIFEGRRRN